MIALSNASARQQKTKTKTKTTISISENYGQEVSPGIRGPKEEVSLYHICIMYKGY